MVKFENCGFTSIVTSDKLKIEIPIANLVCAFESDPNNTNDYGNPSTIKRGKRQEFAEWVAKWILEEADSEDGTAHIHRAFDSVFELLYEGYEDGGEFLNCPDENEE